MKTFLKISFIYLLSFSLSAVAGTKVSGNLSKAVKNPANNVAVSINGYVDVTATRATIKFCDELSIPCLSINYNYPSIDGHTAKEIGEGLLEKGYTIILFVNYVNETKEKKKFLDTRRNQITGTIKQSGSNSYTFNGTSQQMGDEFFMELREILYKVDVYYLPNGKHLYSGQMRTKRGGLFSGDKSMITSAMKKLAKELKKIGLLK